MLGEPADAGRSSYQLSLTVGSGVGAAAPEASESAAPEGVRASVATDRQAVPTRVTQSIPPAVRRRVLDRDGKKCSVPGCRHSDFLDLHHSRPRAEGGDHDPEYLLTLCGAHHRAAHTGALVVTGSYSRGFVFRHADGRSYATTMSPAA